MKNIALFHAESELYALRKIFGYVPTEIDTGKANFVPLEQLEANMITKEIPMTEGFLYRLIKEAFFAGRNRYSVKGTEDESIKEFLERDTK